ncbi:copper(I)-binding protein [Leucobacter exalbidus]|uniref:Copper(I)-binding protein n=1 Tax=Leucobacter exalbidus TaxID=662960 RepID=A0A940PV63_9MICO|nr:copper chaperone PCu(A)C [Leucobacter exalbidus]MBP1327582.1 copper(I)-binding protein [Leucobacter exalbidus]
MRRAIPLSLASAAIVAALALVGCSEADAGESSTGAVSAEATSQGALAATNPDGAVTLDGGWAKAADGMSGVFGTLHNAGDTDLTLVSATSSVADIVELHESITSGSSTTMREVEGGFSVPAGGSFELAPGGNHIMLMELQAPLLAGDEVPVTLTFDDGSTLDATVLAKDFGGAQENYAGDADAHETEH